MSKVDHSVVMSNFAARPAQLARPVCSTSEHVSCLQVFLTGVQIHSEASVSFSEISLKILSHKLAFGCQLGESKYSSGDEKTLSTTSRVEAKYMLGNDMSTWRIPKRYLETKLELCFSASKIISASWLCRHFLATQK